MKNVWYILVLSFFFFSCTTMSDKRIGEVPDNEIQESVNSSSGNTSITALDTVITLSSNTINSALEKGAKLAFINSSAEAEDELTNYVIEKISYNIIESKKLVILERDELDVIMKEQDFQFSGFVSDESAISIGKMLGAESIASCFIGGSGDLRRIRIKTLHVETGQVQSLLTYNINQYWNDIKQRQRIEQNIVTPTQFINGKTLLIGEIICSGSGFDAKRFHAPINGTFTYGINFEIEHKESGKIYKTKTYKNGLFYFSDLPAGLYKINDYYFLNVNERGGWSDHETIIDGGEDTFELVDGKINNVGMIIWNIAYRKVAEFEYSTGHSIVKNEFNTQYKQKNWDNTEWVNLYIVNE
jgi:hypothetical protein